MNYKLISSTSEVAELLPLLMTKKTMGNDCETTGLDPLSEKMMAYQIGNMDEQYIIDTRKASLEPLRPYLESEEHKKVGHFFSFDYRMMKTNFGIEVEAIRDTYLAEQLLNVGRLKFSTSLQPTLKRRLGVEISKEQRSVFGKGMFYDDYSQDLLEYMANDVKYLPALCLNQCEDLKRDGVGDVWALECDVLPAFCDMELSGQYFDKDLWADIMEEHREKAEEIEKEMQAMAERILPSDGHGGAGLNFNSPIQVISLFKAMRLTYPAYDSETKSYKNVPVTETSDRVLAKIQNSPLVTMLREYRSYSTLLKMFGQSYIDAVHPRTGLLHGGYNQIGAETGRPTKSKDSAVNMLNIPRNMRMRSCFRGAPDEVVEADDFSACELRIWAQLSQDKNLIQAFNERVDIHCYVASKLFRTTVTKTENAHLRIPAKKLNFGIIYGMGVATLHDEINAEGFPITMDETAALYENYTREFRTGMEYLWEAGERAVKHGFLQNLSGRRRYWAQASSQEDRAAIARQGGNFMIQSVNADITKCAMVLIRRLIKKNGFRSKLMNQLYDEIVTRTPAEDSANFHDLKLMVMIDAARCWIKDVPVEVESHVGEYWTK